MNKQLKTAQTAGFFFCVRLAFDSQLNTSCRFENNPNNACLVIPREQLRSIKNTFFGINYSEEQGICSFYVN